MNLFPPPYELLLARGDFEDWIQLIIVAVVVIGSALGGVAKKIIDALSEQKPQSPDEQHPRRRQRRAYPVARPMPTATQPPPPPPTRVQPATRLEPRTFEGSPTAPPVISAGPGVFEVPSPTRPSRPARPTRSLRAQPPHRPAPPTSPPRPPSQQTSPRSQWLEQIHRKAAVVRTEETPSAAAPPPETRQFQQIEPMVADHLRQLHPTVEDRAGRVGAEVEHHLGHLAPRVGGSPGAPGQGPSISGGGLSTPAGLRQAVILSELLAPPLALRPAEDRW